MTAGDTKPSKPGISFGLRTDANKRPGVKGSVLFDKPFEQEVTKKKTTVSEGLIIPLPGGPSGTSTARQEYSIHEIYEKYEPGKIGLQVRRKQPMEDTVEPGGLLPLLHKVVPQTDVDPDVYDKIPIEQYGLALLRGMGWREGEGVGRNRQLVKMSEHKMRPRGLGLGADPSKLAFQENEKKEHDIEFSEVSSLVGLGSFVTIIAGEHKGETGVVRELVVDVAKIELSEKSGVIITAKLSDLQLELSKQDAEETVVPVSTGPRWLCPHIRIRITHPAHHYYKQVITIIDTHTDQEGVMRAVAQLDDGRIVTDLHAGLVGPIKPRLRSCVYILEGEHQGQRGTLLDNNSTTAHVQLVETLEVISLSIDHITEHIS